MWQNLSKYKAIRWNAKFMKCANCKSRMAAGYLSELHANCAVCGASLMGKLAQRHLASLEKKLDALQTKLKASHDKTRAKALEKSSKTKWLIAGWGAS